MRPENKKWKRNAFTPIAFQMYTFPSAALMFILIALLYQHNAILIFALIARDRWNKSKETYFFQQTPTRKMKAKKTNETKIRHSYYAYIKIIFIYRYIDNKLTNQIFILTIDSLLSIKLWIFLFLPFVIFDFVNRIC